MLIWVFSYYKEAQICYAYLAGLSGAVDPYIADEFAAHQWFGRGWTLQELIAPKEVVFFTDRETNVQDSVGSDEYAEHGSESDTEEEQIQTSWVCLGRKSSMCERLSSITGIDGSILSHSRDIRSISVAKRMSWASRRVTSRVEDRAYCLIGLFDVNMPMLYGEGDKAFIRLQEEILKDSGDESLFLWTDDDTESSATTGLLAPSPDAFKGSGQFFPYFDWEPRAPFFKTNQGLQITLPLRRVEDDIYVASLNCCQPIGTDGFAGLYLKRITNYAGPSQSGYYDQYARIRADTILAITTSLDRGNVTTFYVRQSTVAIPSSLRVYPEHIVQLRRGPDASLGYSLDGTMGLRSDNTLSMASWEWIPKGLEFAFRIPKAANRLVAVIVIARMDDTKFTILLGSASDLGDVASQVFDGCDENRTFGEWGDEFQAQPPDYVSYLPQERVWIDISSKVVQGRKYFVADLSIEKRASIIDELDVLEETPMREAIKILDKSVGLISGSSESYLPVQGRTRGKAVNIKKLFSPRNGSLKE